MSVVDAALWGAASAGDVERVRQLLQDRAINLGYVAGDKQDTPLHRACRLGHLGVVRELLRHPGLPVAAGNGGTASAFHLACQEGHEEVCCCCWWRTCGTRPGSRTSPRWTRRARCGTRRRRASSSWCRWCWPPSSWWTRPRGPAGTTGRRRSRGASSPP